MFMSLSVNETIFIRKIGHFYISKACFCNTAHGLSGRFKKKLVKNGEFGTNKYDNDFCGDLGYVQLVS